MLDLRTEVVVDQQGSYSGKSNGLKCPSSGNEAPSVRWRIKDIYGNEYAFFKMSQYYCWDGLVVSNATRTGPPDPAVITADVTALGGLAGLVLDSRGSSSGQYEQYNGQTKGSWRAVTSGTKFTARIFYGPIPYTVFQPQLTIVVRSDGTVVRGCIPSGGSCPAGT
ncbi:hypothetical protein AB0H28_27615 [Micromonospora sp. NPDC050980]|uniref:hypothetical protein n=1 Tax=Micromonospora sp. NPDC050980 TaxID=3155161 RepID=UPI0033D32D23